MKKNIKILGLIFIVCGILGLNPVFSKEESMINKKEIFLIDDFSNSNGISSLGTNWEMVTDQVMGGVSEGSFAFKEIDGRRCLHLKGDVSLENRGGFVQAALPLEINKKPVNASEYSGVRILVRGNDEKYFIHFRTGRTLLPWQYYKAEFKASEEWKSVDIPFDSFIPERLKGAFNPKKMKRIAVVAAEKAFQADVAVARIEFY